VLAVAEILPYASGLPRNIVQCLDDYGIPLFLNHTVVSIDGDERIEKVTLQQVDSHWALVPGTEQTFSCDTLLLSLGLIPENELGKDLGIELDEHTGGPLVNQELETSLDGFFACGNSLQVYDTVDMLVVDAQRAGRHAGDYAVRKPPTAIQKRTVRKINVLPGANVRYVVPQRVTRDGIVHFTLRAQRPDCGTILRIRAGENELLKKKLPWVNPVSLISVELTVPAEVIAAGKDIEVTIGDH
jgi:NADPH-dependent 2,4-dienoyl-CoA reductase/sulfur reductase-like enzyme